MAAVLFWSNLCREAWGLRRFGAGYTQRVLPMPKYPSGAAEERRRVPYRFHACVSPCGRPLLGRCQLDRSHVQRLPMGGDGLDAEGRLAGLG